MPQSSWGSAARQACNTDALRSSCTVPVLVQYPVPLLGTRNQRFPSSVVGVRAVTRAFGSPTSLLRYCTSQTSEPRTRRQHASVTEREPERG